MKQNPIPKAIALLLVSIGVAYLMKNYDGSELSKIDSISPADYVQQQRNHHIHSFSFHYIMMLVFGGFYIGTIEVIAYLIELVIPKKTDA